MKVLSPNSSLRRTFLASTLGLLAATFVFQAENLQAAPEPSRKSTSPAKAAASSQNQPIGIIINGRNVDSDPAPLLREGRVFVPLRGVLENLGATVQYDAATSRIDIQQKSKRYSLQVGQTSVAVESSVQTLSEAPFLTAGRAFVPLRALAELFGYEVDWLPATQTVSIQDETLLAQTAEHNALLRKSGRYGITVNFHDSNPNDIEQLLDAVKRSGARLVKFRFDWNSLEPEKGAEFQWPLYDRVVRAARNRGLTIIGVLGNTTRWATLYPRSENPNEWRNSPPKASELPAWDNYVRRVVGRYRNDVQAWQLWENPATQNFRSGSKDYRIVARRAVESARAADPKAVLFVGEPGGVNLGYIEDLRSNGLLPIVSGVSVYPYSQWQPGVPANAEDMLLPLSTLFKDPKNRSKLYWVHGLSRLSLEPDDLEEPRSQEVFRSEDEALRKKLVKEFTPSAQADYLVRSAALSLAAGVEKVFWGNLRDEESYDPVDPVNAHYGSGLLKRDGTPRPAYAAYSNFIEQIGDKPYLGAVTAGPQAVVLIFGDEKDSIGVAWAAPNAGARARLTFDPARDPGMPGAVHLETRTGSRVLDATGKLIGEESGSINLTESPVWFTSLSFKVAQKLRDENADKTLTRLISGKKPSAGREVLRAVFAEGKNGTEEGLYWRKYLGFRGAANRFAVGEDYEGLMTTFSRDVLNPAAGQPNIYIDVADDYLFFSRGTPVKVTVEVKRPPANEGPFAPKGGFNLQYDSPTGFKNTPWNVVEGGEGWTTFEIEIPDASFANREGYDLMINTWGAKRDLVFRNITLQKIDARIASDELVPELLAN